MGERERAAEQLRSLADQIESGGLDEFGPFIWQTGKGLLKLGATGEFPEGKLNKDDEGELQLAVGTKDGQVIIDFGKPVTWIAMNPSGAKQFSDFICKRAEEAERQR